MMLVATCALYRKMGWLQVTLIAVWDADAGAVGVIFRGDRDRLRGHYG